MNRWEKNIVDVELLKYIKIPIQWYTKSLYLIAVARKGPLEGLNAPIF